MMMFLSSLQEAIEDEEVQVSKQWIKNLSLALFRAHGQIQLFPWDPEVQLSKQWIKDLSLALVWAHGQIQRFLQETQNPGPLYGL